MIAAWGNHPIKLMVCDQIFFVHRFLVSPSEGRDSGAGALFCYLHLFVISVQSQVLCTDVKSAILSLLN